MTAPCRLTRSLPEVGALHRPCERPHLRNPLRADTTFILHEALVSKSGTSFARPPERTWADKSAREILADIRAFRSLMESVAVTDPRTDAERDIDYRHDIRNGVPEPLAGSRIWTPASAFEYEVRQRARRLGYSEAQIDYTLNGYGR